MSHTVVGLFNNRNEAQAAKQELIKKGFTADNIDLSHKKASTGNKTGTTDTVATTTQVEVTDSVGNFFNSLFGDDQTTARNYSNAAGDADAILTVHVDSAERARQVAEILDRHGVIDIDATSSQHSQHNTTQTTEKTTQNTAHTAQNTAHKADTTAQNVATTQGEMTIPIIEEQLNVGKREVETGGARIRSRIIEKPVEASVRLREEHVIVNRHPVNRAVTDADLTAAKQGDINLTEHSEEAVVNKQARVVEEVVVGKNVTEHQETIRDTVKRTDVEVEEINTNTTAKRVDNKN
jgi:uncharacterized protein (TIGR02271 family)